MEQSYKDHISSNVQFEIEWYVKIPNESKIQTKKDQEWLTSIRGSTPNDSNPNKISNNLVSDRKWRIIKPPQRYGEFELATFAFTVANEVINLKPRNYDEAIASKEVNKWLVAMYIEIVSLYKKKPEYG